MSDIKTKKIEFYKNRTLDDRLFAFVDFFQSNLLAMYKNLFKIALPVSFVQAFLTNQYLSAALNREVSADSEYLSIGLSVIVTGLVSFIGVSVVYALLGSMMRLYEDGKLSKRTTLGDLNGLFVFSAKTFFIFLMQVIVVVAIMVLGVYFERVWLFVFIISFFIFIMPMLSLMVYPIYFEDASIFTAISKGIRFGMNYWGTTMLMVVFGGIFYLIINYIFAIPIYIALMIKTLLFENAGFLADIIGIAGTWVGIFGSYVGIPILFCCLAFQYFNAREEEDGISMIARINDFENL